MASPQFFTLEEANALIPRLTEVVAFVALQMNFARTKRLGVRLDERAHGTRDGIAVDAKAGKRLACGQIPSVRAVHRERGNTGEHAQNSNARQNSHGDSRIKTPESRW